MGDRYLSAAGRAQALGRGDVEDDAGAIAKGAGHQGEEQWQAEDGT